MRLGLIAVGACLLSVGFPADASSEVDACRPALSAQWRDAIVTHPLEPSKHIPIVLINVPRVGPPTQYQEAIRDLMHAFPSFKESADSGILIGCCGFPVFGSISFDDLAKLSAARFAPLCDAGRRSLSTMVQVRMEYRATYEQGVGAAPYFWISH